LTVDCEKHDDAASSFDRHHPTARVGDVGESSSLAVRELTQEASSLADGELSAPLKSGLKDSNNDGFRKEMEVSGEQPLRDPSPKPLGDSCRNSMHATTTTTTTNAFDVARSDEPHCPNSQLEETIITNEGGGYHEITSIDDTGNQALKATMATEKNETKSNYSDPDYAAPTAENESSSPNGCDPDTVLGAEDEDHVEGITGDTIVPSGSDGWSFYDGETQMLPAAPSQAIPPAASSSPVDDSPKCQNPAMDIRAPGLGASVVDVEACMPRSLDKQTHAKHADEKCDGCIIEEGGVICDRENLSPSHNIMKQTPEIGSTLPISYPMDHCFERGDASPSPKEETSWNTSSAHNNNDDDVVDNVEKMGDAGEEAATQLSQDLLFTSPTAAKSNNFSRSPNEHLGSDDPTKTKQFSSSKDDHDSTIANKEGYADIKIMKSSSPSRQENSGGERAEWMSSARHVLHGKEDKAANSFSSPRLLMPSFKPIEMSLKDRANLNEDFGGGEVDDGSDDEFVSVNGQIYDGYDSIENTQDEIEIKDKPSAFKRLSRGTLKSQKHNNSNVKWTNGSKLKASSVDGVVIKPKVLRYERKDSSSEAEFSDGDDDASDDLRQLQTNKRIVKQPIDGGDNAVVDILQSQTDQRVREQLREVNAILPIAKEMHVIASRNKKLSDEIAALKTSYKASIEKLSKEKSKLVAQLKTAEDTIRQNEKSKLVAQLKTAEDTIRQKDQIIKEKNALLDEQFAVIAQMRGALGLGRPIDGNSAAFTKRTPPSAKNTTNKRKKRTGSDSDSDSGDEDDDEVPISALKKRSGSDSDSGDEDEDEVPISALKKRSRSDSDSGDEDDDEVPFSALKSSTLGKKMLGASCTSSIAKKAETVLTPNAAMCSDGASVETSLLGNQWSNAKSKNGWVTSKNTSSKLSKSVWQKLQKLGWKYVCGPEPHNKGM